MSRVRRADEEGQVGEVEAEREGGHAHGGEERAEGHRREHGGLEGEAVVDEAVDQQDDEGDEEGEDAERGHGDDGRDVLQQHEEEADHRRDNVEEEALRGGVAQEARSDGELADEVHDGDLGWRPRSAATRVPTCTPQMVIR